MGTLRQTSRKGDYPECQHHLVLRLMSETQGIAQCRHHREDGSHLDSRPAVHILCQRNVERILTPVQVIYRKGDDIVTSLSR